MASTFIQLPITEAIITGNVSVTIDKVKIWDGSDTLQVNSNGSININDNSNANSSFVYAEILSVAPSVLSTVLTYTPAVSGVLTNINISGTQIASFTILKNSATIEKCRTHFGNLTKSLPLAIQYVNGDTIEVKVEHTRPNTGNFNANLNFINF